MQKQCFYAFLAIWYWQTALHNWKAICFLWVRGKKYWCSSQRDEIWYIISPRKAVICLAWRKVVKGCKLKFQSMLCVFFCPIWLKFVSEDVYKNLLSRHDFCEYRRSGNCSLLRLVSEFLLLTFCPVFNEIRCEKFLRNMMSFICEFRENRHEWNYIQANAATPNGILKIKKTTVKSVYCVIECIIFSL